MSSGFPASSSNTTQEQIADNRRALLSPVAPWVWTAACRALQAALGYHLVGILRWCLTHHVAYDESVAWGIVGRPELPPSCLSFPAWYV
jgi:hypothetical protein